MSIQPVGAPLQLYKPPGSNNFDFCEMWSLYKKHDEFVYKIIKINNIDKTIVR